MILAKAICVAQKFPKKSRTIFRVNNDMSVEYGKPN